MASPVFLLVLLFLSFSRTAKPDLESDKTALLAFRSAVGRNLPWSASQSPCLWQGIQCSSNRVTAVRLPGVGLMGPIPPSTVGNLTQLRTLSLRFNALNGQLPSDLSLCVNLRNLYLQGNFFSGQIPPSILLLKNLIRLNLAHNNFSGGISPSFNNLTRLGTLYLEGNQLDGPIPDLNLQNLQQFNVSGNRLSGPVPSGLRKMPANAFAGNSLCGGPLAACPGAETPSQPPSSLPLSKLPKTKKKKKLSGGAIAGIAVGSVLGFLLIIVILCVFCRKKSPKKTRSVDIATVKPPMAELEIPPEKTGAGDGDSSSFSAAAAVPKGSSGEVSGSNAKKLVFFGNVGGRVFDLEDLLRASAEVLGKGTFGTAYKAVLEVGTIVAVKRLKDVGIPEREFRDKIEAVGSMDHQNLVPLKAYYFSKDEKLLVYDYMPMGSLSALLHGNRGAGRTPLNWETRTRIALEAARGIEYLHSRGPAVSHGNIKSSNVLLTKSYGARVSDFGLAHLGGSSATPNRVGGYRAPEVTDARKVSQKADVYSFGVLLLELLTGKAPSHAVLNEEGVDLPRWVQSVVREEWTAEVFDLELLRYQSVEEDMVQLLQLAIDCAAQYPDNRPSMSEVSRRIEELCRSSLPQDHDGNQHSIDDDGSSRRTNPVDGSGPPPPSSLLFD
ncbi:probable inactive receptor kinase At1g48480 [Magnolia sinica]|uniref:probable inactive receptor kinase At1g48480 n=1 Tax=Magnolia sinica TaxID=86752 RepID=UPI00265AC076|nr:probable inactive receptor kinase At1g48480 [Magnolia sinica]